MFHVSVLVRVEMRVYKMRVSGPPFIALFHVLYVYNYRQILFTKTLIFIYIKTK